MQIGVPKEIKSQEYRVGLTPTGVRELTGRGHLVWVEAGAGAAIGLSDQAYLDAGAHRVDSPEQLFGQAELIVKVKEPLPAERALLRPGQLLFTFLHLAPDPEQTRDLLASEAIGIAYETVRDRDGRLPLLAPMSEVAGRMSVQAAAHCLEKSQGGRGVLLAGVPGVEPGRVLVLGGGVVGLNAARMAAGLGAQVSVLDKSLPRLRLIDDQFGGGMSTLYSTRDSLETELRRSDAVIGAVLVPGAATPKLVDRDMLALLPAGAVLVDVAIDQGGCFATSRPTTHDDPTYQVDGIIHYCVANMPGAVARTATQALTHATLPYVLALAEQGLDALRRDTGFAAGLSVYRGELTCAGTGEAQGLSWRSPAEVLGE